MFDRQKVIVLVVPTVAAFLFLNTFAFPYLTDNIGRLGIYWPRREWLYAHIIGAMFPLLLGPSYFWFGINRVVLALYGLGVVVSGTAALYLAFYTNSGWVAQIGFISMSIAWMLATILAIVAIFRGITDQHNEWMIRSYVVTVAFVVFRGFREILSLTNRGTFVEQLSAAAWLSWSVPLMITEVILQGKKIFARIPKIAAATSSNRTVS